MSKILVVSGLQVFPPVSGGQLRTSTLCASLEKAGHDVYIYSFTGRRAEYLQGKKNSEYALSNTLKEYINRSRIAGLVQHLSYRVGLPPFWLTLLTHFYLPRELRGKLQWCDTLIIDFPFLYPVFSRFKKQKILNTHNIEANLYENSLISKMVRKIERSAVEHANTSLFCSESDMEYFQSDYPDKSLCILPNGVEVNKYEQDDALRQQYRNDLKLQAQHVALFTGSSYRLNREAFDRLVSWSNTNKQQLVDSNIVILVVGSVSNAVINEKHLRVTGRVESVFPYFAVADSALNPVSGGSGTNVKMMEYIAAKLPILTTKFGARGVELEPDSECLYFEFDNLLERLLVMASMTEEQRKKMAEDAFKANAARIDMEQALSLLSLQW